MKKGDQVETPYGKGEIYRLYYSGESGKPYSAHIKYPDGEIKLVFLSECTLCHMTLKTETEQHR